MTVNRYQNGSFGEVVDVAVSQGTGYGQSATVLVKRPNGSWEQIYPSDTLPDSVVLQYYANTWSQGESTWVDSTSTADMSLTGNFQSDTLSDGNASIRGDGTDDFGTVTLPTELEGSVLNAWSIEMAIEYSTAEPGSWFCGLRNSNDTQRFGFRMDQDQDFNTDNGNFQFEFSDKSGANGIIVSPDTNPNLDDGQRHNISVIINDASQADVDIIIDGVSLNLNFNKSRSLTQFGAWDTDFNVWSLNNEGDSVSYKTGEVAAMRLHDSAISQQTISDYPNE